MDKCINLFSIGNKLIVESYKDDRSLRATKNTGFAMVEQKVKLKGLKVLVDAKLNDGTYIEMGTLAYIKEELLHSQPWATRVFKSDNIAEDFLIVDLNFVEFFSAEVAKTEKMTDEEIEKAYSDYDTALNEDHKTKTKNDIRGK